MAQQRAEYPLDYTTTEPPKEPLPAATEGAGGKHLSAAESAQEIASNLTEQAKQYAGKAEQAARQFKPFVERSLKEQPMTTLAGAAVIGFVLGALWKK
jgi:ElaB/YqjD/DUF883 family membrane-anchored ribosome-binding protein